MPRTEPTWGRSRWIEERSDNPVTSGGAEWLSVMSGVSGVKRSACTLGCHYETLCPDIIVFWQNLEAVMMIHFKMRLHRRSGEDDSFIEGLFSWTFRLIRKQRTWTFNVQMTLFNILKFNIRSTKKLHFWTNSLSWWFAMHQAVSQRYK